MASRGCVCFVGNLPGDVREREIEDLFYKYGRIRNIDLKLPPRPPAFAFVEFENPRDAEDAVKGRDGYDFDGNSIRVELSRGGTMGRGGMGGGGGGGGGYRDDYRGGGGGGYPAVPHGRGPPPVAPPNFRSKGSAHRVLVKGLPMSASWQDLKDHFRKVCTPNYVNVFRDRGGVIGVVEFDTPEDLARAIRKLDDTEFRNPFERAYIRVYDDSDAKKGGGGRGRSRSRDSRSYSRSRSRSRSPSDSRSRSRSRSRSPSGSRSPSRSSRSGSEASDKEDRKDDKVEAADKEEAADKGGDSEPKADDGDEPMADEEKPAGDSPVAAANGTDHKEDDKAAEEDDD